MGKLPRLELMEEKSTLKNNDYIVFRHQSKGKSFKKVFKKNMSTKRKKSYKNRSKKSFLHLLHFKRRF